MLHRGWFFAFDHQNKARSYIEALQKFGYRRTYDFGRAVVALSDLDNDGRIKTLAPIVDAGGLAFLYPHAARPPIQWDGIFPPWTGISAHFIQNAGTAEIMHLYGYSRPIHVTGWSLCEQRPFQPVRKPVNVLWGPIHANHNGYLHEVHVKINRATWQRLRKLVEERRIILTIRYIRSLRETGLDNVMGVPVTLVKGQPDLSTNDIDAADVVVGHQTFAYLAVARGKPTLMMGEDVAPASGNSDDNFRFVKSWPVYRDLLRFPLDILDFSGDPMQAICDAAHGSYRVQQWRDRYIGEPFDGSRFVKLINEYVDGGHPQSD